MKSLRKYLLALAALLLLLGLLIWFLPARWAVPWIEPHLHGLRLTQVHGTLWQGRSDQVLSRGGQPVGTARWQLSRQSLLGKPGLQLDFVGPWLSFSGFITQLADQKIDVREVRLRADIERLELTTGSPLGEPRGSLTVHVRHALLQAGWPMELDLKAQWTGAAVQMVDGSLALGVLVLQAQSHSGIIQAAMHDIDNGPLAATGNVQFSPLGWRLDATLSSRQTDPRLRRWLAQFGPAAADGRVHIQQSGGLAGTLPAPEAKEDAKQP